MNQRDPQDFILFFSERIAELNMDPDQTGIWDRSIWGYDQIQGTNKLQR
jgi:hypothetical protein